MKTFIIFFIITFAICVPIGVAEAYDDETTHPALTSEIVNFYNTLYPNDALSEEEKAWIVKGSIEEDTSPRWMNHFYDPIYKEGWSGEKTGNLPPAVVRALSQILVSSEKSVSAVEWINNRTIQSKYSRYDGDNTWQYGLEEYMKGNRREAYVTLGHALHLFEDMSVPEHTRNDTHAPLKEVTGDEGSPFEDYLTKWNVGSIRKLKIPEILKDEGLRPKDKRSVEEYLISMAEYSNKYFFSKDTINDSKYNAPKIVMRRGDFGFGLDENNEWFPLTMIDIDGLKNGASNEIYSIKNKIEYYPILDAYFERLSKKVVLQGAGVINLFLSQIEDRRITEEFPSHLVKYDFSFLDTPSFSFLGEIVKAKNILEKFWGSVTETANTTFDLIATVFEKESEGGKEVTLDDNLDKNKTTQDKNNTPFYSAYIANFEEEPETEIIEEKPEVKENKTENIIELQEKLENKEIIEKEEKENNEDNIEKDTKKDDTQDGHDEMVEENQNSEVTKSQNGDSEIENQDDNTNLFQTPPGGGNGPSVSEPIPQIDITEIMYNLSGSDNNREWVEILNSGNTSFNGSDITFFENETNHRVESASGFSTVFPGDYVVIADDPTSFISDNIGFTGKIFKSSFSLNNSGETLKIKKGDIVIDTVLYSSKMGAYGNGNSLQLINNEWLESIPTPGKENNFIETNEDVDENNNSENSETTNTNGTKADNVVISEIQVGGIDAGDEFIEFYNPNESETDISEWSVQYVNGTQEISTSTVFKKNIEASSTIPTHGFFLIAREKDSDDTDGYTGDIAPDLTHRTFFLSGSDTGGKIFLVNNQEEIDSIEDENIVDFVDYSFSVPQKGKSLERKGWNNVCISSISGSENEFFGNGCNTNTNTDDFEINTLPNPQNTKSLPEPRNPPSKIEQFTATYNPDALTLTFIWGKSKDFLNSSDVTYQIFNGSSSDVFAESTSTAFLKHISNIGGTYSFSIRAFDRDGLGSEKKKIEDVEIPSFLSDGNLYKDANTGAYVFEGYYNEYPFVKRLYSFDNTWKLIAFYKNQNPEDEEYLNTADQNAIASSTLAKMLSAHFKTCGDIETDSKIIILPDTLTRCNVVGEYNGDFSFEELEDNHIKIQFSSSTSFSSGDYVTVAYYDKWPGSVPRTFRLAAKDEKHYKFQNTTPEHSPPVMGNTEISFHKETSQIEIIWDKATDVDTIDSKIVYEINVSKGNSINNELWENIGNKTSYKVVVIPSDIFTIGVRARDDLGINSSPKIEKWQYATSTFSIVQDQNNGWSDPFGKVQNSLNKPDSASFQSIVPEQNIKLNSVTIKIWQDMIGITGPTTLRLGVYKDTGLDKPDFSEVLGETTISEAENYVMGQEIAFSFPTPIDLIKDIKYWLVLDVASYADSKAFFQNTWKNAIFFGPDLYTNGEAGSGFAKSPTGSCDECAFSGNYSVGPADWYMKLGLTQ